MGQFKVFNSFPEEFTFISNSFLDFYMPSANGEFVKIYLYLLRHASGKGTTLDLSSIADAFNCTEADIQRALRYWKNCGILNTVFDGNGNLKEIIFYSPKKSRIPLMKLQSLRKKRYPLISHLHQTKSES